MTKQNTLCTFSDAIQPKYFTSHEQLTNQCNFEKKEQLKSQDQISIQEFNG